jgi:aromatic amino acid aminotransferase I
MYCFDINNKHLLLPNNIRIFNINYQHPAFRRHISVCTDHTAPHPIAMRGVIRFRAGALRETRHSTSASTSPAACFLDRSGVVRDSHLRLRALAGAACSFHSSSRDRSETLGTAAKLPDAEPVAPVPPQQRRLTVADVLERRAKAGRLVAPTAAYSDADMFKAPVC